MFTSLQLQAGNPRQGGQAAQEPGCHQLAFGGSWVPQATCDTYCCRIMGILTQLAAATAAKGTQRASKGGARCGKQAGSAQESRMCPAAPPGPGLAYLGVEVESHCGGQGCTGGCDISHPDLPGQRFQRRETTESPTLTQPCSFCAQDTKGVFTGHPGVHQAHSILWGLLTSERWGRQHCGWCS